jgi:hypothetical protein
MTGIHVLLRGNPAWAALDAMDLLKGREKGLRGLKYEQWPVFGLARISQTQVVKRWWAMPVVVPKPDSSAGFKGLLQWYTAQASPGWLKVVRDALVPQALASGTHSRPKVLGLGMDSVRADAASARVAYLATIMGEAKEVVEAPKQSFMLNLVSSAGVRFFSRLL